MTFALLARFETPAVPLKDICQEFLGINPKTAEQKAKACDLPFPTFKTRNSERSPTLVNVADLGDYLNDQYSLGRKEWERVNH